MFKFNVEISLLGDNYLKALNRADIGAVTNAKEPLDGLILTGGGDVAPCLYGERCTHANDIDLMRDQKEFLLIKFEILPLEREESIYFPTIFDINLRVRTFKIILPGIVL